MKYNTIQARHAVLRERQVRLINARALRFAALLACAAALLLAKPVEGSTTLYVAKNNESAAEPYATWGTAAADVKTAVAYAKSIVETEGTVEILVGAGQYNEAAISLTSGITLRGATGNRDDVKIWPSSYTSKTTQKVIVASGSAVIADLTIGNGYVYAASGSWAFGGGATLTDGATITNCHITACTAHNYAYGAGLAVRNSYAYDCLVDSCTAKPFTSGTPIQLKGFAVFIDGNSLVDRCQIVDNSATGTKYTSNYFGGALCVFNSSSSSYADSCIVRNCLIARNSVTYTDSTSGCIGIGASLRGGIIDNCTIVSNKSSVAGNSAGVVTFHENYGTVRNCHIAENYSGDTLKNYNIIDPSKTTYHKRFQYCCTKPQHTSFTSCVLDVDGTWEFDKKGDFRLLKGSPCIDAASQQTWMAGAIDLYGNDRKLYGKADIGAVEYVKSGGFIVVVK